jgi:hypothetical protein
VGQSDLSPPIQRLTARGILHTKRTVFNIRGDCRRTARHPRSVNAAYANR